MDNDLLTVDNIILNVDASDYKDAIFVAGKILADKGYITDTYINNMIDAVSTMGPYMVLMPGFALVHAEPCKDVIKTSMSIITLNEGVNFGSVNDPVKLIMCLACTDKSSHIDALKNIATNLLKDNMIDNLLQCQSKEELYKTLKGE